MFLYQGSHATISKIVDDILCIEITNSMISEKLFQYKILSLEASIIRKGNFKGPKVQMSLSLMQDASYTFQLFNGDNLIEHCSLYKLR